MDITLKRILSLIPKKPDGKYVHGAKKAFANSLGYSEGNIVSMWESGNSDSYKTKLHEISAKYDVSVEWLKGETDEKRPAKKGESKDALMAAVETMSREELIEMLERVTARLKEK